LASLSAGKPVLLGTVNPKTIHMSEKSPLVRSADFRPENRIVDEKPLALIGSARAETAGGL
jgi:hypothetical protein